MAAPPVSKIVRAAAPRRVAGPALAHIPALDGLRGISVIAVVAYHLGWLSGGFLGVDVFFVLSGFLVTSLLLLELDDTGRIDLRNFWARRVRRLLPAVMVLVPVVVLAALLLGWPAVRLDALVVDAFSTLTWWANWRQASGTSYWAADTPNLFRHAWSLSIEEQFYLVWPLVVVATAALARTVGWSVRRAVGAVAVGGFAASSGWLLWLSARLDPSDLSRAYVGTDTRVLAPLAGCALACWWHAGGDPARLGRRGRATHGNGLLNAVSVGAVAVLFVTARVADPGLYRRGGLVLAALAAAMVVAAILRTTGADGETGLAVQWMRHPALRHVGLRSYAIYLWSWPVQALAEHRFPTISRPLLTVGVVVASLLLAELSHALVEDPVRREDGWARSPVVRRGGWLAGAGAAVAVLVLAGAAAVPPPVHEQIDTTQSLAAAQHAPPSMGVGPDSTRPGEPERQRVLLLGDSVAFTLAYHAPPADQLPEGMATFDSRAVIGCGLLASTGWSYQDPDGSGWKAPGGGACGEQAAAEELGLTGRPDVVVIMPGAWEYQAARSAQGYVVPAQSSEMRSLLVDTLVARAAKAHAVGASFAMVAWACPGTLATAERSDPTYIAWINEVMHEAAGTARSLAIDAWVIDPTDAVCDGGLATAAPTDERRVAIANEVHILDQAGARWMLDEWLAPALVAHNRR